LIVGTYAKRFYKPPVAAVVLRSQLGPTVEPPLAIYCGAGQWHIRGAPGYQDH
jgi:hypothetical protein